MRNNELRINWDHGKLQCIQSLSSFTPFFHTCRHTHNFNSNLQSLLKFALNSFSTGQSVPQLFNFLPSPILLCTAHLIYNYYFPPNLRKWTNRHRHERKNDEKVRVPQSNRQCSHVTEISFPFRVPECPGSYH